MKTLLFYYFLFSFTMIWAQERVSNVEYIIPVGLESAQITQIDSNEYLIAQTENTTRITLLDDYGTLLHSLVRQPEKQTRVYTHKFCHINQALTYKDRYLVELYTNTIYLTDIITGETERTILLSDSTLSFSRVMGIFNDNKMIVRLTHSRMVEVDLETGTIEIIPFILPPNSHQIGHKIYYNVENLLYVYDLLTQTEKIELDVENTIYLVRPFTLNCEQNLAIATTDGKVFIINNSYEIQQFECIINNILENIYIKENIAFITWRENSASKIVMYDFENCSVLQDLPNHTIYYDIPEFPDDKILLSKKGSFLVSAHHFVFDIKSKEIKTISFKYYSPSEFLTGQNTHPFTKGNSYVHNNKLFINSIDAHHYFKFYMYEIDLNTYEAHLIALPNETAVQIISFRGVFENKLNIIKSYNRSFTECYKYDLLDKNAQFVNVLHANANTGISESQVLTYKDKIITCNRNGIYMTQNKTTNLITSGKSSLFIQIHNDDLFIIGKILQEELGYIKYNFNSGNSTYKKLLDTNSNFAQYTATDCAIVIEFGGSDRHILYLNDEIFQEQSIMFNNSKVSGSHILEISRQMNTRYIFVQNTCTKEVKQIPITSFQNEFYPAGKGIYYYTLINDRKKELYKIDNEFNVAKTLEIPNIPRYYYDTHLGLPGDTKVIPFPNKDTIMFFIEKEGHIFTTSLPHKGTLYYEKFFWRQSGDIILVESKDISGNWEVFVWEVGETPIKINTPFDNYRVNEAIVDGDKVVIIYSSARDGLAKIVDYDYSKIRLHQ